MNWHCFSPLTRDQDRDGSSGHSAQWRSFYLLFLLNSSSDHCKDILWKYVVFLLWLALLFCVVYGPSIIFKKSFKLTSTNLAKSFGRLRKVGNGWGKFWQKWFCSIWLFWWIWCVWKKINKGMSDVTKSLLKAKLENFQTLESTQMSANVGF